MRSLALTTTQQHALELILDHLGIGVPAARRGERRYPMQTLGT
jgi:hypothetical protein